MMTSPVDMNSRRFTASPAAPKRGRHTVMSYVSTRHHHHHHTSSLNESFASSHSNQSRITPSPQLFSNNSGGRHSVPLSTPTPAVPLPTLAFIREGTNISQLSYNSEASSPGPLTRERSLLRNQLRTKTRGGTRYVMKYNDHNVRVERADGRRINRRRSRSRESIVSLSCRLTDIYMYV